MVCCSQNACQEFSLGVPLICKVVEKMTKGFVIKNSGACSDKGCHSPTKSGNLGNNSLDPRWSLPSSDLVGGEDDRHSNTTNNNRLPRSRLLRSLKPDSYIC